MDIKWLITCEHASHNILRRFRPYFETVENQQRLLSHEGYDKGAIQYARALAATLHAPLFEGKQSRLLIELNRSQGHPRHFSSISSLFSDADKQFLMTGIYLPFRNAVYDWIDNQLQNCPGAVVIHLSCHTFTPIFHGVCRKTKLGILFDPSSPLEKQLAKHLKNSMSVYIGGDKVHLNKPYKGISDGHTTALRKLFGIQRYVGIELEFSLDCFEQLNGQEAITRHVWIPALTRALLSFSDHLRNT